MNKQEKMLEIVNKLNTAMATTNSDFRGNVEFSIMRDNSYMISLTHLDNRYESEINFIMMFERNTEEQFNNFLLLALDVINYNRLIEEEKNEFI